eukprot:TRINITY_DN6556_c0_g2_i1.p1 TRINITY_DN6556_c0_g2~~TRINITY_DN6556_c0_g2_i1.p1  ORF type:complete len:412 (+),score=33.90 TRINITY_DN6556_c0_g2_i1:58-1293(+)
MAPLISTVGLVAWAGVTAFARAEAEANCTADTKLNGILSTDKLAAGSATVDVALNKQWTERAEIYEYTSTANPKMEEVPFRTFGAELHQQGPSRVVPFDLSDDLHLDYPATAPNLMANFVRINIGEDLPTGLERATSQVFYVIRGTGSSLSRAGKVDWKEGDLFVLPYLGDNATAVCDVKSQCVLHHCDEDPHFGGCALYWVHDEPLLKYLGVRPDAERRFEPTLYPGDLMKETVAAISNLDENGQVRNRRGILLGNTATPQTKTLTPTLWSLLNTLGGHAHQDPHKHNSVALDLAVSAGQTGTVYTLLGRSLNMNGTITNPIRAEWQSGSVFVTPPGWWHSHHNEGSSPAWVLPVQDAGLYTHQRTLDIRFLQQEVERLKNGVNRGATLPDTQAPVPPPMVMGSARTAEI